ncbi:ATP-grasp domain-containing protein [Bacillus sp. EB600]|uniref:ATP-grasp domain-containing protein n=1 Tax=Bacillus sp. EB600 TaxID=2806345 RepID=UPI00210A1AF4|nr:ATP-grasp domain-containing protein [Bacillus sp. EB600]
MKKIMILGASILQLPAILKAKEMGLRVIAVDMDKNSIGFKEAHVCLEISTIDIPKVVEAAKEFQVDGVITLASDMPMRTVAAVAKEMGIAGISEDTAIKATNKAFMREALKAHEVPIPLFFRVTSKDDYAKYVKKFKSRCIVKPADNSGSRGVFLIEDLENKRLVEHAFEYSKKFSRSGEIIIEEYMSGEEVSVEALSVDGEVHVIAITDKLTTGVPHFVEMGHSQPTHFSDEIKERIEQVATMAIKAIGIENGPSHTEIMVTEEGPKIVEIGARLGGDNITTHLTPLSTGVNMVESCIKIALGEKPYLVPKFSKSSAIRYFRPKTGVLKSIDGVEVSKSVEGVQQVSFVKKIGDKVEAINSSSDRIGFVIAQSDTAQGAIEICEKAMNLIDIVFIEGD